MKKKHVINLFIASFSFIVIILITNYEKLSPIRYESLELHSSFAAIMGLIALLMSWLMFRKGREDQGSKFTVLSRGFLAIGIIRIFISITPLGHGSEVLHHTVDLIGAVIFSVVWFPKVQKYILNKKWFPWFLSSITIILGVRHFLAKYILLKEIEFENVFGFIIQLDYTAGVLFVISMIYFLMEYYRKNKSEDLLIGMVMLIFGISSSLSYESVRWSLDWWGWHVILMTGYIIMLGYFFRDYRITRTQLSVSMAKFQQIFENAPDGIIQIDSNANIIDCNQGECDLLGYERDEIVGKHITSFLSKESFELSKKAFPILQKSGHFETELDLVRKDGTIIPVWRAINAIYDKDGNFITAIAHTHDITNRIESKNEILKLNTELEQKIIDRTHELEDKVQKLNKTQKAMLFMVEDLNKTSKQLRLERENLDDSNKELEAFAYSIAHDLRTPLRAIDGFTSILSEDYASKFDDEGKRLGVQIMSNAKKMAKLIDDLLAFSRLGSISMSLSKIDMKDMVNAIYNEVTSSDERKRIKFTVRKLPAINGDTNMMHQVWVNLISNAIKFSSKRKQAIISVSSKIEQEKTTYFIKDNGAGFDMKYADKVFGVFHRLHNEREFEGTGVGLALVRRIIQRHGGNIWAEGEVDIGATLYFSMPKKISAKM